jgi:AcrR family transcriptional regulator
MAAQERHGDRVKVSILAAGLALWRCNPGSVSARAIGQRIGMSHSAVLYHYKSSDALKTAIAAEAVRIGDKVIIPMLIASRHPAADTLNANDRRRFLADC